jgi:hypothetical protein
VNRTRDGALAVLKQTADAVRGGIDDNAARDLLTEELLAAIFDAAWRHQFAEDRSAFRNEVKELVTDAIEAMLLKEAGK